jgi:hypothetical protein
MIPFANPSMGVATLSLVEEAVWTGAMPPQSGGLPAEIAWIGIGIGILFAIIFILIFIRLIISAIPFSGGGAMPPQSGGPSFSRAGTTILPPISENPSSIVVPKPRCARCHRVMYGAINPGPRPSGKKRICARCKHGRKMITDPKAIFDFVDRNYETTWLDLGIDCLCGGGCVGAESVLVAIVKQG